MATRAAGDRTGGVAVPAPPPAVPSAAKARAIPGGGVTDLLLQRMASVVLGSGVGVVRGRIDGGPRWANDAFLAMSGYRQTDLAALDWGILTLGDTLPPTARAGAIAPTVELEFARKDGSRWPVIVSRGTDPTDASQLILFVVDLTASRVAEAARRAADQRYARFFEISNVAFWTADAMGRATLTSVTTADRLGSDVELLDFEAQAQLIHPDDQARAIATWEASIASGQAYDMEIRARGLDGGEFRWTRLQAFPDVVGDAVVGWYGTTEDIHERRLAADALVESEARFKRLADDIPVMVWLTDVDGNATYLSKTWYDFTGQTEAEALGRGWTGAVVAADQSTMSPTLRAMAQGEPFDLDFRLRAADGSTRWMLSAGRPRRDTAGAVIGYAGALTDIHARKVAERELADTKMRLSRALDGTGVGVWEWDAATDSVSVSGSALGISGIHSPNEQYSQVDYRSAVHKDDRAQLLEAMNAYVEGRSQEFTCEVRIRRNDGGWVWVLDRGTATQRDASGRATHMVGTLTNIDDSKCAAERLRWTVDHDALTGLASRTLFHARLDEALASGERVALALLDIDDFKGVNDVLGHAAGDALLGELARRLGEFGRPGETVARLGGDEFTLIIPGGADDRRLVARLERLRVRLAEPFVHDGQALTCRSSIGVAIAPDHGNDAQTLLKSADIAMYSAKAGGRGAVALYETSLGARIRSEAAALAMVRTALDDDRIVPFYEPIVRLLDGKPVGYEVTPHITGDAGCAIDIHEFDAAFGEAELSCRLGDRVMDRVIADYAAWRARGGAPEFVAVNVAAAELRRSDYAARLLERLSVYGIPTDCLRIEIVETRPQRGPNGASGEATLAALRDGGLLAGLDKFGVGSASLVHLSQLPLAAVKIDQQLVRDVAAGGKDRLIVQAIAGLGKNFDLRIVALGVETAEQAAALKAMGCDYGQGPWFGVPLDAAAAGAVVA